MFRYGVKFGARMVAAQSRRLTSSSAQPKANKIILLGASAVLGVGCVLLVNPPAQNAVFFSSPLDYKKVRADIVSAIEQADAKRDDGTSIAPTLVRLAWHASGTYSIFDKTGGSSGATMRFAPESEWGANAGLGEARKFMAAIIKKHPQLSSGDAWTLAGAVAVESMGGPSIPWRPGRQDAPSPGPPGPGDKVLPDGRLPNANMGCPSASNSHVRDIFGRMGFNDRETVALIGAHAVGRCHPEASGFWGPWTRAETTFSNDFFVQLLEGKWQPKKTHEGQPWTGPFQFESPDGALMMLPADLWLLQDKEFRKYVELYAKDEELFFKDFSAAFAKLLELGVQFKE